MLAAISRYIDVMATMIFPSIPEFFMADSIAHAYLAVRWFLPELSTKNKVLFFDIILLVLQVMDSISLEVELYIRGYLA